MKKLFYLFALSAFVFTASCGDDDDNGASNGSDAIRQIKVKASEITGLPANHEITNVHVHYGVDEHTIKQVIEWDNGFELELPETVPASYLEPVKDFFEDDLEEATGNLTYSSNAKVGELDLYLYSRDDLYGYLSYRKSSATSFTEIRYICSDSDCNVKGTLTNEYKDDDDYPEGYYAKWVFNVSLKKGWNLVAAVFTLKSDHIEIGVTSSIPSGLSWKYDAWDEDF